MWELPRVSQLVSLEARVLRQVCIWNIKEAFEAITLSRLNPDKVVGWLKWGQYQSITPYNKPVFKMES